MSARIEPVRPPFTAALEETFERIMPPGAPPLALFATLARDDRLWARFRGGALLDKGHLTLRQREIVIDRTTARAGSEYEWGVHVTFFADRAGLDAAMQYSLVHGQADDPCWHDSDRPLIRASDQLFASCTLDDAGWAQLTAAVGEMGAMEVILLAGFYRTVSTLTNALRLPLEPLAARFPARRAV